MRYRASFLIPFVLLSFTQVSMADDATDKGESQVSSIPADRRRLFNVGIDGGGAFQILSGTLPIPAAGWYVGGNFGYDPITHLEINADVNYNGMVTFGNLGVGGLVQMSAGIRYRTTANYGFYIGAAGGYQIAVGLPTGTALTTLQSQIPGSNLETSSGLVGINMGRDWNLFDSGLSLGWEIHYFFIGGVVGTGLTLKYWI